MGRPAEIMCRAFGSRWPLLRVLFSTHSDLCWKCRGAFRFGEPGDDGKITELIDSSGARAAVPKNQNGNSEWYFTNNWSDRFVQATDGDSYFVCFTRFSDQADKAWYQFAESPASQMKFYVQQATKTLEEEHSATVSTDAKISDTILEVQKASRRRMTKGPPEHAMPARFEAQPASLTAPTGELDMA